MDTYSGSSNTCRIDGIYCNDCFNNNKLVQVTLSLKNGNSFSSNQKIFERLSNILRTKYGKELSRNIDTSLGGMAISNWAIGRTNINLVNAPPTLNIIYQNVLAKEADKL